MNYLINQVNHPIYAINNGDVLISKEKGCLSFGFRVHYPSLYGKTISDFEKLKNLYTKILQLVGENTIIHKQEFFISERYNPKANTDESIIEESVRLHFKGRKIRKQYSYIYITKTPVGYVKYDSFRTNSFLKKESKGSLFAPILDEGYISKENYDAFLEVKNKVQRLLEKSIIKGDLLKVKDYVDEVFPLWENFSKKRTYKDFKVTPKGFQLGSNHFKAFTIERSEQLKDDYISEYVEAKEKMHESMMIPKSFISPLGLELEEDHCLNQYFYIPDQEHYLSEIQKDQNRLQNITSWFSKNKKEEVKSQEKQNNEVYSKGLADFKKELAENSNKVILTHVNVLIEELNVEDKNFNIDVKENTTDIIDLYYGACPGNAIGLPTDLYFPLHDKQSFCFFYAEDYTKGNTPYGLRFIDIVSANPIYVDFFRSLKKERLIDNYNMWVVGNSGAGKSFLMNKILLHQYFQGDHIFNIDGSSSFERSTDYVNYLSKGENGFFLKIAPQTKIGLNPFILIQNSREYINDKTVFIANLLTIILKIEDSKKYAVVSALLKEVLLKYYSDPSVVTYKFNTFYDFFEKNAKNVLLEFKIEELVNPHELLFVMRDYYKGGVYEFLLNNTDEKLKDLKNNRYITFQIKELKANPDLFGIVTFLLTSLYKEKLYDKDLLDKIKFIHYDEAWTAMDKPILVEFIKDTIKTVRSQNGATIFTSQEPEDFFESEIIKNAVINNSELGIITSLEKYAENAGKVRTLLSLTETQTNTIFSLGKKLPKDVRCKEFAFLIKRQILRTYGNEVSLEEKAIYESDPDEKVKLNTIDRSTNYNPILTARQYAEDQRERKNT